MLHPCGREGDCAGFDTTRLACDRHLRRALQNHVELVLVGVHVGRVMLAGLESVQAAKEVLAGGEIGLPHLVRTEHGTLRRHFYDHPSSSQTVSDAKAHF